MRLLAAFVGVLLAGCTLGNPTVRNVGADLDTECNGFVEEAAKVDPASADEGDLDLAISGCGSLAELESVGRVYPQAFRGVPVRTFVLNRCRAEVGVSDSAICREVLSTPS